MKRQWFLDSFGAPIADVRAKLIEEAWFGRRVSEPFDTKHFWPERAEQSSRSHSAALAPDRCPHHGRDDDSGIDLDR